MDITETLAPKSDQLNADDLMTGPRTFTIEKVSRGSVEQPVDVHLVETPGRPFRPSKSMRRVMVAAWSPDASTYAGKRLTLYRDPTIRFGGQDVGGIRISHLSGIDKPLTLALTVTRGKRSPYTVKPLADEPAPQRKPDGITDEQIAILKRHYADVPGAERLAEGSSVVGREIDSFSSLSKDEASKLVAWIQGPGEPPLDGDQ